MTDEVAALVLRNNYQQTLALSLAQRRGLDDLGFQQRLMQTLEKRQLLDRAVEFLPNDMEIVERRRRAEPLTRPELAVLLAYAKLVAPRGSVDFEVPDDPYLARELRPLFPAIDLRAGSRTRIEHHRLRRDIISTQLANSMINRGGPALVVRIADQTGASVDRIAARLRGGARQLCAYRAQYRDRGARQPDRRCRPAGPVHRGAEPAARPDRLVPAQRRSRPRARRDRRALPVRDRGRAGGARRLPAAGGAARPRRQRPSG